MFPPATRCAVFYCRKTGCRSRLVVWRCFDLTPFYGFEEDAIHWHRTPVTCACHLAKTFIPVTKSGARILLPQTSQRTARYWRAVLYDLNTPDFDRCFAFMQAVGKATPTLIYQLSSDGKRWPTARRAQFPVISSRSLCRVQSGLDRGTLFGLQTGGRTESILMSCRHWYAGNMIISQKMAAQKRVK